MTTSTWPDSMRLFLQNRPKFPLTELAKYAGRYTAWSPDGTRIVACALKEEDLPMQVQAAGEDPAECVIEWIPDHQGTLGGVQCQ